MLNVQDLPQNFCVGPYIPKYFWPEENCSCNNFVEFIRNLKSGDNDAIEWCVELISQSFYGFDAVAVVPSSTPGKYSGIKDVAQKLATVANKVDA